MFTNAVRSSFPTARARTHSHTHPYQQFAGESLNSGPTVFLCKKSPSGPRGRSPPVQHVSVPTVTAALWPRRAANLMRWGLGYIDLQNWMKSVIDTRCARRKVTVLQTPIVVFFFLKSIIHQNAEPRSWKLGPTQSKVVTRVISVLLKHIHIERRSAFANWTSWSKARLSWLLSTL